MTGRPLADVQIAAADAAGLARNAAQLVDVPRDAGISPEAARALAIARTHLETADHWIQHARRAMGCA